MSDTLHETNYPNDNHDRPWWGLPCTVTPCFGARLVQEGNRLHYLEDIPGVLAVFAERRKDSFGPYVRLMSVTLN